MLSPYLIPFIKEAGVLQTWKTDELNEVIVLCTYDEHHIEKIMGMDLVELWRINRAGGMFYSGAKVGRDKKPVSKSAVDTGSLDIRN